MQYARILRREITARESIIALRMAICGMSESEKKEAQAATVKSTLAKAKKIKARLAARRKAEEAES
jgi:hypothetical protein